MIEVLRFAPVYQERIWGGRALGQLFGRRLPSDVPIGESWEIVDRPEAQSVVVEGRWAGRTLRSILETHGVEVMGRHWPPARRFPILVKWLDCRERLSLQVHPPADRAAVLHGEPKTENWFIAEASRGAALMVGLRRGVGRGDFERALADGNLERCVNRFEVAAGDSILVRSGTVHAIDAGCVILEIQQNSDTTYRVYDWGRTGADGKPRRLHLQEALESICWDQPEPQPLRTPPGPAALADCEEFRIRQVPLPRGGRLELAAGEQPRLLHVVRGSLEEQTERTRLQRGENALLPQAGGFVFAATEDALVLLTENFT